MKRKTILIALVVFLIALYFAWDKPFMQKLRGVAPPTPEGPESTDKSFNVKLSETVKDDSFPLTIGSNGDNVVRLQKSLNKINAGFPFMSKYTALVADGNFGQKTYEAVLTLAGTSFWSPLGLTQSKWNQIMQRASQLA